MPVPISELPPNTRGMLSWEIRYKKEHGEPVARIALEKNILVNGSAYHVVVEDVPIEDYYGDPHYGRYFAFMVDGICGTGYSHPQLALEGAKQALAQRNT